MHTDKLVPPYILCFMADTQGCGWHRIQIPLGTIVSAGLADGRMDMNVWPIEAVVAAQPDVVVWQRQVEDGQLTVMQKYREALPKTFFIYEIDDHLGDVPTASYHRSFMPPNLEDRVRRGIALCDAVSTTTEQMAEWVRSLGATDVRVIPNVIPMNRLREREQRLNDSKSRLRVGWGGGISHAGDLALIKQAVEEIGNAVQWVFLCMKPDGIQAADVEFHDGVPPDQYLDKLQSLNLDLILAPIEENVFNGCKSNLRLVEAGSVNAAVIATPFGPYLENNPPVFGYASTPEDWIYQIRKFMETPKAARQRSADALRSWVSRHYVTEVHLHSRLAAWTRKEEDTTPFRPRAPRIRLEDTVVSCIAEREWVKLPRALRNAPLASNLMAAVREALVKGSDLLWIRPDTILSDATWAQMQSTLASDDKIAAVIPISTDGPNSFPRRESFTPIPPVTGAEIDAAFKVVAAGRRLDVMALGGPCALISRSALAWLGCPPVEECGGSEEIAALEWGFRAKVHGRRIVQVADSFVSSMCPIPSVTQESLQRLHARGYGQLLHVPFDILTEREREEVELRLINVQWPGPRPGMMNLRNDYPTRHLMQVPAPIIPTNECIVGAYEYPFAPDKFVAQDIHEWVVLVAEGTVLKPDALSRLNEVALAADPEVIAIYGDHDTNMGGNLVPYFKPDFDLELLLGKDYITPVVAVRLQHLKDFNIQSRVDLFDAIVIMLPTQHMVLHVPYVLATEEDPTPEEKALYAIQRCGIVQDVLGDEARVTPHKNAIGSLVVVRKTSQTPLVTIIMPTKGDGWMLQPAIQTVLDKTTYSNFEIVVVMNGDKEPELGESQDDPRVRVIHWNKDFNWSALNNYAVKTEARGSILCFMNDDVRVCEPGWLDVMVAQALREDVGAVGARLIYPHGLVQHIGVVSHKGIMGHIHKGLPVNTTGYHDIAILSHENSAVTAAVMVVSLFRFNLVGGFDETLSHNYNDVVFCLKLGERGYRNIVETSAELIHMEGQTRPSPFTEIGRNKLRSENKIVADNYTKPDPYWNPNFNLNVNTEGLLIQGLNYEVLQWNDMDPKDGADHVLVINPGVNDAEVIKLLHARKIVFGADMSGFVMRLNAPATPNGQNWDIRDADNLRRVLSLLHIKRIILRSLVGQTGAAPPVEALRSLHAVGIPVDLQPLEARLLAPWLDDDILDVSQFGLVDMTNWRRAYDELAATDVADVSVAAE